MTLKTLPIIVISFLGLTACTHSGTAYDISPSGKTMSKMISPVKVTSQTDYAATEARLRQAIDARGLKLFTVVDHGAGARSVDLDIGESKLFIFGNPKAGTPLMLSNPDMGLELPLKILLTSNGDDTVLSYSDITVTAKAYSVTDKNLLLEKISGNLAAIAQEAATP